PPPLLWNIPVQLPEVAKEVTDSAVSPQAPGRKLCPTPPPNPPSNRNRSPTTKAPQPPSSIAASVEPPTTSRVYEATARLRRINARARLQKFRRRKSLRANELHDYEVLQDPTGDDDVPLVDYEDPFTFLP